jgi:hypothetical protein
MLPFIDLVLLDFWSLFSLILHWDDMTLSISSFLTTLWKHMLVVLGLVNFTWLF